MARDRPCAPGAGSAPRISRRHVVRRPRIIGLAAVPLVLSAVAVAGASSAAADSSSGPSTLYSVAFTSPNGLPADVDAMVAAAGGTVTDRLPEIGGISATSSDPSFAANLDSNPAVKAVAPSVQLGL